MNKYGCPLFLLALLLGTSIACADTLTLKSGEKLEGKILRETENDITIEVKVSASVKDERMIAKDDLLKVNRLTEDDIAFEEIKNIKPDPASSLAAATYEQIITRLKTFQDNFPNSAHHADVQTALDAFQAEKTRVDAGEVKFRGAWIGADEAAKMKTEIAAVQLFTAMKFQGARGDLPGALNTFGRIEKDAKGASVFPDAIDYAKQVLASLQAQVERSLSIWAHNDADFKRLIELSTDVKKAEVLGIAKREQDNYDAQLAAAQKAGLKWMPLFPRSRKSLDALKQAIPTEITRLATLPVQKMREANSRVDQAKAAIDSKDYTTAEGLLKEAAAFWPENDGAKRLGSVIVAANAAANAAAKPVATPTPKNNSAAVAAASAAASAAAAAAAAEAAKAAADSAKPFFMTIPGAMTILGVVILIAGAIALMGRARKPTDEEPQ